MVETKRGKLVKTNEIQMYFYSSPQVLVNISLPCQVLVTSTFNSSFMLPFLFPFSVSTSSSSP
jgi:hypothetical protein